MLTKESLLNNHTVVFGWLGSTIFSGANIVETLINQVHILTLIGWVITSGFAIVASIYKIKHTTAETRKLNAIATKIEREEALETSSSSSSRDTEPEEIVRLCDLNNCMYKDFYDNFNPILMSHFGKESPNIN